MFATEHSLNMHVGDAAVIFLGWVCARIAAETAAVTMSAAKRKSPAMQGFNMVGLVEA